MKPHRQEELGIVRQAAEWIIVLEDAGVREQEAFAEWLLKSPLHVQEFLNQTAVHRLFDNLDPQHRLDVKAMLKGSTDNVIELQPVPESSLATGAPASRAAPQPARRSRRRWILAAAATLAMAIPVAGWLLMQQERPHYITAVGEQRIVELDDGSLMHLSARSRAQVRFDTRAREIRLLQGEALFTVRHDAQRPFRVRAGDTVVRALGTQFNVNRRSRDTTVAVIEGTVEVTEGSRAPARVAAGETIQVGAAGVIGRATVEPERMAAWRQRRLVFQSDTLEDMAAEFNRYNRTPIIRIEGDTLRQRRFSGVLDADDPQSLLHLLEEADDLTTERRGEELLIRVRGRS